ncbi:discoidin domain-containing protein [Carboxylicivirga sp. RSCT41]|uniref:galactose-binding domain-containing protein n=1 Tax=Carboxylicivirga agarovorans TaxID=3417570 RepID=UPI003D3499FD
MSFKNLLSNHLYSIILVTAGITSGSLSKAQLVSEEMPIKVIEASEWDEIQRNNGTAGWVSGDGQMSIPLDGCDKIGHAQNVMTFWINSDSRFCTELDPYTLRMENGKAFINHSAAVMNKVNPDEAPTFEDLDYWFGGNNDKVSKENLFPVGLNHAWTIDGWADGNFLHLFLLDKDKVDGTLHDYAVHMIKLPIVKDKYGEIVDVDYSSYTYEESIPWLLRDPDNPGYSEPKTVMASCLHDNTPEGGAVFNSDEYIYNYGVRKLKVSRNVVLSRVKRSEFTQWDKYEYWNNDTQSWGDDESVLYDGRGNIVNGVGGIFSITPITSGLYEGKYMLVTIRKQDNPTIVYRIGESLTGPFGEEHVAYGALKEMDAYGNSDVNFYNGKAHPHISNPGELLISYSANRKEDKSWLTTDKNRIRFISLVLGERAGEAPLFIVSLGAGNANSSASGYISSDYKPSNAFSKSCEDAKKWSDDTPGDKWLKVDLQRPFYVERWQVVHEGGIYPKGEGDAGKNTRDFKLQVSNNETDWTTIDEVTGNVADFTERDIPETEGRYWRLYITNPSQDGTDVANIVNMNLIGRVQPTEIKVATQNLGLNKAVVVSSGLLKENITDGAYNTKWSVDAADGQQWFYIDLGEEKDIYRWRLSTAGVNGDRAARNIFDFDVLLSNDAQSWTKINEVRYNIRQTIRGKVEYRARYIKVRVVTPTLSSDPEVSINEFEVFGGTGATIKSLDEVTALDDISCPQLEVLQLTPNPFENSCSLKYTLFSQQHLNVSVSNAIGQTVKVLVNKEQAPGTYELNLVGRELASGVYYCSLKTANFQLTKKIVKR